MAAAAAAEVMTTQRHTIATLQNRVGRLEGLQRKKKNEDRFAAAFGVKRIKDGFPLRVVRCVRACICVSDYLQKPIKFVVCADVVSLS